MSVSASSAAAHEHPARKHPVTRATIILLVASALAVALNATIASVAIALGVGRGFPPLDWSKYGTFTIVGVLAGWIGWRLVQRLATRPARVLAVLVPAIALASFIPDVLLATLHFIPGGSIQATIALMSMHIVVIGIAVPAYALASPTQR